MDRNKYQRKITILSASQLGNATQVAKQLFDSLTKAQLPATLIASGDYPLHRIATEDILLMVCSTQGEGDPPEEAFSLYNFLHSQKAPNLSQLSFAVLALGDSSYYLTFCQAGKSFDEKFAELGAKRLLPRVDCDFDFEETAYGWIANVVELLTILVMKNDELKREPIIKPIPTYTKEHPYLATLILRQTITSNHIDKEVQHLELDISHAPLPYQAGDSLGVWFKNDPQLVEDILQVCKLTGNEAIKLDDGKQATIRYALSSLTEISQNSVQFIKRLAAISLNEELLHIANDPEASHKLATSTNIISLLKKYPADIYAQALYHFLPPIQPRFYSIASSPLTFPNKIHLTVGMVYFKQNEKVYTGSASGFLGKRLNVGEHLNMFVMPNPHFKLPQDRSKPIIMIASGTGIAPFRAFMQERVQIEATGKNWLFFGNQALSDDFLYQTEWQTWYQQGQLSQMSLAWSREGAKKVYVQHKIKQEAELLWQWLQQGAYIYVCGSAEKMAKAVEEILLQIIKEQGKLSEEKSAEYLDGLRIAKRYQRDVY